MCVGFDCARNNVLQGERWTRGAWFQGEFIYLVPSSEFPVNRAPLLGIFPTGTMIKYRAHIDKYYADGSCGVWNPCQEDLIATDWTPLSSKEEQFEQSRQLSLQLHHTV